MKEVLIEYKQYKKCLSIASDTPNVLGVIQLELEKIDRSVELCCCDQFVVKDNLYRIQRWSNKFQCYVDIVNADEEVQDGDRLLVTNKLNIETKEGDVKVPLHWVAHTHYITSNDQ